MIKKLLGEELYQQVMDKLGDKKIMVDDGNFIPKARFDEVNNQKRELKEQVDTLNDTLKTNNKDFEKFKKLAEGNEELQKQLQETQNKFNSTQEELKSTMTAKEKEWQQREVDNRKAYTLREKLLIEKADPKYIELMMKTIDLNSITEADGKLIGIDDITKNAKESFPELFIKTQIVGTGLNGGASNQNQKTNLESLYKKAQETRSQADLEAYSKAKLEYKEE